MARTHGTRTVSPAEKAVGIALLAALAGFLVLIAARGAHYEFDAVMHAAPAPEGAGNAPRGAGPASEELLPAAFGAIGWTRDGAIETYPEDRLFEKIDGADERYKLFGNRRLLSASYVYDKDGRARLDVFLYEMRTPLAALGIFGRERSPQAAVTGDMGDAAYLMQGSAFFRKGVWYGQVKGFAEDTAAASEQIARAIAARLPAGEAPELAFGFLPAEERIRGSERYEPKDSVLGTDFLAQVFSADYGRGEKAATLFVARCGKETEARRAAYAEYLKRQGKVIEESVLDGASVTLMDLDGAFDGFFAEGEVLAGVAGAADQAALRKLLAALVRSVRAPGTPAAGPGPD